MKFILHLGRSSLSFLAVCAASMGDEFMKQVARNLTESAVGFLDDKCAVLMDRDADVTCDSIATQKHQSELAPVLLEPSPPILVAA